MAVLMVAVGGVAGGLHLAAVLRERHHFLEEQGRRHVHHRLAGGDQFGGSRGRGARGARSVGSRGANRDSGQEQKGQTAHGNLRKIMLGRL